MKCRNEEEEEARDDSINRSMPQTMGGRAFGLAHRCIRTDDAFGVCLCCLWPPYNKPKHTTGLITQSKTNI